MTWDICRICDGSCCSEINLIYVKSHKKLYPSRRRKTLEKYPFLRYNPETRLYSCEEYVDGLCQIYDEKPGWCNDFFCRKHDVLTEIRIMEGNL